MAANGALLLQFTNYLKMTFAVVLQQAFKHPFTPEEYHYDDVESKRQISIYRAFPKRTTKYPIIIVEAGEGVMDIDKLGGEEIIRENFDGQGTVVSSVFSGNMTVPIKIRVLAETTTDRERITDLVAIYARYAFRQLFHKYNISYLAISAGDDGEEESPGTKSGQIFKGICEITCFMEFEQDVDQTFLDAIMAIDLSQVTAGTDSADQTPIFSPVTP